MADFVEAARLDEVPVGAGRAVTIEGKPIALFNVGGQVHAIGDTCPHMGGSLGLGQLDGTIVTCNLHGMKIDVVSGCFAGTTGFAVVSYPVKIVAGKIMVAVDRSLTI